MNKLKRKPELTLVKTKVPQSRVGKQKVVVNKTTDLESLATVSFWKEEISTLKSAKITSVEQAVDLLIEQVLKRLKLKNRDHAETIEFLRLVFETSGVLQETLRNTLKL